MLQLLYVLILFPVYGRSEWNSEQFRRVDNIRKECSVFHNIDKIPLEYSVSDLIVDEKHKFLFCTIPKVC